MFAVRLRVHRAENPDLPLSDIAARYDVPVERLEAGTEELGRRGLMVAAAGSTGHTVTEPGLDILGRLDATGRERLARLCAGWSPDESPELRRLIGQLASELFVRSPSRCAEAGGAARRAPAGSWALVKRRCAGPQRGVLLPR